MMTGHRTVLVFALVLCAPLALSFACQDDPFREYIVECEEALARVKDCCPGFDATRLECTEHYTNDKGCGTGNFRVAFSKTESQCILDSECERLIESGVCARAQTAHDQPADASAFPPPSPEDRGVARRAPVCP